MKVVATRFFVAELVGYAERGGDPGALAHVSLDRVLAERVAQLDASSRLLLEVSAVAATPKPLSLLANALNVDRDRVRRAVRDLRSQRLVRTGASGQVRCYHDRIRASVCSGLTAAHRRDLHARLARALMQEADADPAEVGSHLLEAECATDALVWLERAAGRALQNLAFAQASRMFERCLSLSVSERDNNDRARLLIGYGHALARGGQSARAASAYLEAASVSPNEADQVQARVWAAQHLLQGARFDKGAALARSVLKELGVPISDSAPLAYARVFGQITAHYLSGGIPEPSSERLPSQSDELKLHALMRLSENFGATDPPGFVQCHLHYLRAATKQRSHYHMARALTLNASFRKLVYGGGAVQARQAERLVETCDEPSLRALFDQVRGVEFVASGELDRAEQLLSRSEVVYTQQCPDEAWAVVNVRSTLGAVYWERGDHWYLAETVPRWLAEARSRGDRYALAFLWTFGRGYITLLMQDRARDAFHEIHEALAPFAAMRGAGIVQDAAAHALGMLSRYWGGQGDDCLTELAQFRSLLQWSEHNELAMRSLWQAATGPDQARSAALRAAARHARKCGDRHGTSSQLARASLCAQVAAAQGRTEQALEQVEHALQLCGTGRLFMAAALHQLKGELLGGQQGEQERQGAASALGELGWHNPRAAMRMVMPMLASFT